jgi:hypothetical protein
MAFLLLLALLVAFDLQLMALQHMLMSLLLMSTQA